MRKRTFIHSLVIAALCVPLSIPAAEFTLPDDGCDVLGNSVGAAVRRAVAVHFGNLADTEPTNRELVINGIRTCDRTSRIATAAFTVAFADAGFSVSWSGPGPQPGDYCDSHFLSECYPRADRLPPGVTADARLVERTWQAVANSLATFMPYGPGSDYVAFAEALLAESLQAHVTAFVGDGDYDPRRPLIKRPHRR